MDSVSRVYGFIDNTRDLTLEAARDASTFQKPPPTTVPIPTAQLKKLLDSRHEQEILTGLRRVVVLTQKHSPDDLSYLLPTVLKNISSPNTHIRKLVYIFLLYNAESDQDTALLAINSIQKSLSASDAHLRALALRTISSLKVPVIAQIVALGIKRGTGDMSPIVRRTAAFAIPKCWRLDSTTQPQLETCLSQLQGDRQYFVAGAAIVAFNQCCPERIDMIHANYRTLVRMLVDMDEWGQLATLRMLTSYARSCFPQLIKRVKKPTAQQTAENFYDELPAGSSLKQDDPENQDADSESVVAYDPDLESLLKSSQPLLSSRSSAVVVAVAAMYMALTVSPKSAEPSSYILLTVGPLVALLRGAPATASVALQNIIQILLHYPKPFVRYARHFVLRAGDGDDTAALKLEALSLLYPHAPQHIQSLILAELTHAAASANVVLVRASIAALGRCAQAAVPESKTSQRCLRLLLSQVSAPPQSAANTQTEGAAAPAIAASEALTQIRHIIQTNPDAHVATVIRLAKDLDTTTQPAARASIVWLVGEYAAIDVERDSFTGRGLGNVAADVLRILAKRFADEDEIVKRQILTLAAKVYLQHLTSSEQTDSQDVSEDKSESQAEPVPDTKTGEQAASQISHLYAYVHHLTRYDTSYTLRDLARTYRALLPVPSLSTAPSTIATPTAVTTQLATLLLNAPKPAPVQQSPSSLRHELQLGSASLVVGPDAGAQGLRGYTDLPDWVKVGQEPDPRLRDGDKPRELSANALAPASGSHAKPAAAALDAAAQSRPPRAEKTLDDWLDEEDAEDEVEDDEDEEDESEDEESSSEEEGSTEEESDDLDERGKLVK